MGLFKCLLYLCGVVSCSTLTDKLFQGLSIFSCLLPGIKVDVELFEVCLDLLEHGVLSEAGSTGLVVECESQAF